MAAGCFLWGYHANQVVLPEDVIDGEADERVYNEQFQYRRTEYQDDFERYPWFDTISFIGEIIPYSEDYAGDKIYIRALDASGSSDAFGSNGWLAQQDGLVIEKDGEALQWRIWRWEISCEWSILLELCLYQLYLRIIPSI